MKGINLREFEELVLLTIAALMEQYKPFACASEVATDFFL